MGKSRLSVTMVLLAALLSVAIGCGGDDESSAADGEDESAESASFTVGVVDPDLGSIALLEAIDVLKADGHDVKSVEVAEPELAIEGIAQGRFQFSGETTSTALAAAQQGAPVRLIGDLAGNAWSLWAQQSVGACEDLGGRPFGIFSQGSVATAMVKNWVAQTCPGTEPEYLVLGESSTRFAALQAGEIDGTALELADTLRIDSDALRELVDFGEEFPELRPSTLYANADYISENPEATQTFVDAVAEVDAQINESPQHLAELIRKHLPDTENIDQVAEAYSERGVFDVTQLDQASLEYTIDFFEQAGSIEPGLTVDDAADFSFIENVSTEETQ